MGDGIPQNFSDPVSMRQHRGQLVEVASNMDKEAIMTGGSRLTQFVMEPPQSTEIIINSAERVRGSPFQFEVDVGAPLFRARLAHINTVVLPRQFNITPKNNRIWVSTCYAINGDPANPGFTNPNVPNGGSKAFEIVLTPGYYGVDAFKTEFGVKMKDALRKQWYTGGTGVAIVNPQFDAKTNQFSFDFSLPDFDKEAGFGGSTYTWYWVWSSTCPFVERGRNFIPVLPFGKSEEPERDGKIQTLPFNVGDDPLSSFTNVNNVARFITSGSAALIYSRYTTVRSRSLNQYSYAAARSSRSSDEGNVIATIENVSDTGLMGSGKVFTVQKNLQGPYISIVNPQKQLIQFLDIEFRDEYGEVLDELYPPGTGGTGPTVWLTVTF
jgi:hypothetical protein